MQYRANLVLWLVVGAIGSFTMILVWFAILGTRSEIAGYGRGDFIVYYIFMTVGFYVVGGSYSRMIGQAIRNGEINKNLLQPYSVILGKFAREQAWKVTSIVITLPPLAIIAYLLCDYLSWEMVKGEWWQIATSLILGAILFAIIEAIIGIMAFWVTEVWPFTEMWEMLLSFFGGTMAPIALLPIVVQRATVYLPFRYVFYEPIAIALGKESEPVKALWLQGLFIVIMYGIYRLLWARGIRKYEAIGD
jgi:ABC-2 type transport system permease protein